jgi:release factor glutamine methyltransferase
MPPATASVGEALEAAVEGLTAAGVETPRLDAELLLAEASGIERARLAAEPGGELPPGPGRRFGELVRRRLRREPVAYILGRRGFRHIELAVDRRVLIPRPETELLVELALELRPIGAPHVLDVGTGSGAIALALADELPDCEVVATDTSAPALEVARANAKRLGFSERIRFEEGTLPAECGDLVRNTVTKSPHRGFDLVLANLPYVAERDWSSLQPEVTRWEPREALLAGPDGLDAYRALLAKPRERFSSRIPVTAPFTCPVVGLEVGDGQAGAVAEMLRGAGFEETEARRDLAGIERVVVGRRPGGDAESDQGDDLGADREEEDGDEVSGG